MVTIVTRMIKIICIFMAVVFSMALTPSELNTQLETLSPSFLSSFFSHYYISESTLNMSAIQEDPGSYLLLLGKTHLYGVLNEKGRFGLAYFYLKIAAELYENAEAYYFLAVMEYHRITPDQTMLTNLQPFLKSHPQIEPLASYLKISHSYQIEHSLYLSSLLSFNGASVVMANLLKEGIGMHSNCSTSIAYYLAAIRNTYVDDYHYRSVYQRQGNYEKELYSKRRIDYSELGNQDDAGIISESGYLDQQMLDATLTMADNYFIGRKGYIQNFTKAFDLYQKLARANHKTGQSMLGLLYFKGQGVQKDRKKAKQLFEQSKGYDVSDYMLLTMKYFGLDGPQGKAEALQKMKSIFKNRKEKKIPAVYKYLLGAVIVKGELNDIVADEGYVLMQQSVKFGNNQARITLALLFLDGSPSLNYDCLRSANYLKDESIYHPFLWQTSQLLQDKINLAQIAIKRQMYSYALVKQMQLLMAGQQNSFINALYLIQVYHESLEIKKDSFSLSAIMRNPIYQQLNKNRIVPDISSYYLRKYSLQSGSFFKHSTFPSFFQGSDEISSAYRSYLKMKTIKVGARTTDFSILKFFEFKLEQSSTTNRKFSDSLLNSIAADSKDKPHVLEARYLLGKIYHQEAAGKKGRRNYADKYKAIKEYTRAAKSEFLGNLIYEIEEHKLKQQGKVVYPEEIDLRLVNDLLAYTFVLSIMIFVLYYLRSRRLDELHRLEVAKQKEKMKREEMEREDLERISKLQTQMNERMIRQNSEKMEAQKKENQMAQRDPSMPVITEDRPAKKEGIRIGSDFQ